MPTEDEIREVVERVVAGLGAASAPPSQPSPDAQPAAQPAPPAVRPTARPAVGPAAHPAVGPAAHPAVGPAAHPALGPAAHPEPQSTADGRIAIGADHGGFALKERLGFKLREAGWDVDDCGTDTGESVDYPDFAAAVARKVADGDCRWGIVVDGAGIGSAMAANKVPGVRAAMCYDVSTARNSREHNHANVLTLGAGMIGDSLAWQIVEAWLATPWGGGRHARRVAKIDALEHHPVST